MLNFKKKSRSSSEVNAGSMADIAFLLLIFFLVTTTIDIDKGISIALPPWVDDLQVTSLPERNVFKVLVNKENKLFIRGQDSSIKDLRDKAKEFIMNPLKDDKLAKSPKKAIISLQNDRGTNYDTYLAVYNELKASYSELWNIESKAKYNSPYEALKKTEQQEIRNKIPFVLSEAEPVEY